MFKEIQVMSDLMSFRLTPSTPVQFPLLLCVLSDVDNYLWNIFGVNAVYWIAHVLLGRHNEREGKHAGGGDAVVKSEDPAVNMNMGDVEQTTQLAEYLQHREV